MTLDFHANLFHMGPALRPALISEIYEVLIINFVVSYMSKAKYI